MEQVIQLKTMRDAALERLQGNPDFKLVNSLDALIRDLEAVVEPLVESAQAAPQDEVVAASEESLRETIEVTAESDVDTSLEIDEEQSTLPAESVLASETQIEEEAGEQDEIVDAVAESAGDEATPDGADQPDEAAAIEAQDEQPTLSAEEDLASEPELAQKAGEQDETAEALLESDGDDAAPLSADQPDEAAAAIEALEAELSQSDAGTERISSLPG